MSKNIENAYYPKDGFVLTHFMTVADPKRLAEFYLRIFGGETVRSGEPTIIQIANSWLVFNTGGGPTDDKPAVTLRAPQNLSEVNNFMIIRVADIWTYYEEWKKRGAEFLTEPKDHKLEIAAIFAIPTDILSKSGKLNRGFST